MSSTSHGGILGDETRGMRGGATNSYLDLNLLQGVYIYVHGRASPEMISSWQSLHIIVGSEIKHPAGNERSRTELEANSLADP